MRSQSEVEDMAAELIPFEVGEKKTYLSEKWIEGVSHALQWVLGNEDDPPLPPEE